MLEKGPLLTANFSASFALSVNSKWNFWLHEMRAHFQKSPFVEWAKSQSSISSNLYQTFSKALITYRILERIKSALKRGRWEKGRKRWHRYDCRRRDKTGLSLSRTYIHTHWHTRTLSLSQLLVNDKTFISRLNPIWRKLDLWHVAKCNLIPRHFPAN